MRLRNAIPACFSSSAVIVSLSGALLFFREFIILLISVIVGLSSSVSSAEQLGISSSWGLPLFSNSRKYSCHLLSTSFLLVSMFPSLFLHKHSFGLNSLVRCLTFLKLLVLFVIVTFFDLLYLFIVLSCFSFADFGRRSFLITKFSFTISRSSL